MMPEETFTNQTLSDFLSLTSYFSFALSAKKFKQYSNTLKENNRIYIATEDSSRHYFHAYRSYRIVDPAGNNKTPLPARQRLLFVVLRSATCPGF